MANFLTEDQIEQIALETLNSDFGCETLFGPDNVEKLSALHAVVKSRADKDPFMFIEEAGVVSICHSRFSNVPLLLRNKDALETFSSLLERKLRLFIESNNSM